MPQHPVAPRPFLHRYTRQALTAVTTASICVLLGGCISLGGSGGGVIGIGIPTPEPTTKPDANSFKISYDNWLEFSNDLTITIDSVFARIEAGDHDAQKLAGDFIRPGLDVLANNYGISLSLPLPIPEPKLRQFQFQTDWSPWATSSTLESSFSKLLLHPVPPGNCRWRAKLLKSYAEFNSLTPKRVNIHAELLVWVQVYDERSRSWGYPLLADKAKNELRLSMRKDLLASYRTYLINDFGVNPSTFRGFHEN